jgi:N-acetylglutamate synthase-like GNAT family acetyltransferase
MSAEVLVRQATVDDVDEIVALDRARYGDMTDAITADASSMFAERINNSHGWFWVAEIDGRVEGLLAGHPTSMTPEDFVCWEESTSNGTLAGTYDPTSKICYIASMTASHKGSEHGVVDSLLANAVQKSVKERKQTAYFISRMPGYHEHADTMTPQAYAAATSMQNGKSVPLDPQIRFYEEFGTRRLRLIENGFAADWESCGYGVLFSVEVPFYGWPIPALWAHVVGVVTRHRRIFAFFARLAG